MKKIIEIKNVSIGYSKKTVLEKIEITLNVGDFLVVSGGNGTGKSAFLKFLYMKIPPFSGSYKIFDEEIMFTDRKRINNLRKKIGVILQKNYLIPYLTVLQNVELALEIQNDGSISELNRVYEILNWVGLEKKEKFKIQELSDSERQKVVIARSLVSNPRILIADEPMLYLDSSSREKLFFLLNTINKLGTTIIIADNINKTSYKNTLQINIEDYFVKK